MGFNVWMMATLVVSIVLGLLGFAVYRLKKHKPSVSFASQRPEEKRPYEISYASSGKEWSGSTSGALPIKVLTYRQYECLEDARYGFNIVGVTPTGRKAVQPHQTRAHGQKTVASLLKHGFLASTDAKIYVITDLGLNALQVCDVRY